MKEAHKIPFAIGGDALGRRRWLRGLCLACLAVGAGRPVAGWAQGAGNVAYTVKRGETLSGIARAHGVTVRELKRVNGLESDLIRVGQKLVIPPPVGNGVLAPVVAATEGLRIARDRWQHIVAHHSAIEAGNAEIYGRAHRRRGMAHGLAYHFVIGCGRDSEDGQIEVGPRWREQLRGGHVRNALVNDTGIGICLVGNLQNRSPTRRQLASFIQLVDYLRGATIAPDAAFTVHRWVDRNHTVCPGRHFPYDEMKARYGA
jgi:LysM repeat protein